MNAASFVGLWLLIPCAIGGVVLLLLGLLLLLLPGSPEVPNGIWLGLTLIAQAGFWSFVCKKSGLPPVRGLWALIPLIALVPTFFIARRALLVQAQ